MSEEVAPVVEPIVEPSALPSDVDIQTETVNSFEVTDSIKEKYFSNEKILDKYDSIESLIEGHKNLQDKHAQYVDDTKKQEKDIVASVSKDTKASEQDSKLNGYIPEFMEAGMVLTPELEAKIVESGIDIRDVKLGAIDLRDRINSAHQVVGGKENYDSMLAWAGENISQEQKVAFDKDIKNDFGEYAIKGLYNDYVNAGGEQAPIKRLTGDTATRGIQAYADKRELFRDKAYIDSNAGKKDTAAINRYKARLGATPKEVWLGK